MPDYLKNKDFCATFANNGAKNKAKRWKCYQLLTENIVKKWHFDTPQDKEDMVSELLIFCLRQEKKYDRNSNKAFNFFTKVCYNKMRDLTRIETKKQQQKNKYQEEITRDSKYKPLNITDFQK